MQFIIPLLFFAIMVGLSVYRSKKQNNSLDSMAQWPYEKRTNPLTPEETTFYRALNQYLDPSLVVFPKIRIQNLVYASPESRITYALLAKMQDKYLDFAICEADSLNIVCVIEFDDGVAPLKTEQENADMERILRSAALILFRYQPQYQYSDTDFTQINNLYHQGSY